MNAQAVYLQWRMDTNGRRPRTAPAVGPPRAAQNRWPEDQHVRGHNRVRPSRAAHRGPPKHRAWEQKVATTQRRRHKQHKYTHRHLMVRPQALGGEAPVMGNNLEDHRFFIDSRQQAAIAAAKRRVPSRGQSEAKANVPRPPGEPHAKRYTRPHSAAVPSGGLARAREASSAQAEPAMPSTNQLQDAPGDFMSKDLITRLDLALLRREKQRQRRAGPAALFM